MMLGLNGRRRTRRAWMFVVLGLWLLGSGLAHADDESPPLERQVKAAYIFKFTDYIYWPEGSFSAANTPVTIAVVGDNMLAEELTQIVAGRSVAGRPLQVTKVEDVGSLGDARILFVGRKEISRLPQWVKVLESKPILVITDAANTLPQGAMINFLRVQNRLKFEISLEEVEKHGLKLSSRLLAVAHDVREAPRP